MAYRLAMIDPDEQQTKPHPRDLPPGTRLLFAIFGVLMTIVYLVEINSSREWTQDSCRISVVGQGLACAATHGSGTLRHT